MFRLVHISDPHLGPLPAVRMRDLASKRVTGYVNWRRNRVRHHRQGVVDLVADAAAALEPDHIAVTGDLVNLALDEEFGRARLWLDRLGEPRDVTVVPGNHDAYVPGALDKACQAWAPYMNGDGDAPHPGRDVFPFLRRRGEVAIIGVSSARATAPFMANGFFRAAQAARLSSLLRQAHRDGLCRVVLIHHPPVRGAISNVGRLLGIGLFQRVIAAEGAELVLHGHTHLPTIARIAGRDGAVPVVGISAAGQGPGGRKPPAGLNLVTIDGRARSWRLRLERHVLVGESVILDEAAAVDLAPPLSA